MNTPTHPLDPLREPLREARGRFLEVLEPLRPELFRYARGLTSSVWEAEDLVQESLTRAFSNLSRLDAIKNPRAYVFRILTNAWIDELSRRRPELLAVEPERVDEVDETRPLEVREALETLVWALPPRQRVAVLLRDVFGFSIEESARAMVTTAGAAKASLFRARQTLRSRGGAPAPSSPRAPSAELVDAFVEAFNARDLDALMALIAPEATTEIVGVAADTGPDAARNVLTHTLREETLRRAEAIDYRGGWIVVLWYAVEDGDEVVGDVIHLEQTAQVATRSRSYYFAPDVLRAIGEELGLAVRTQGYAISI